MLIQHNLQTFLVISSRTKGPMVNLNQEVLSLFKFLFVLSTGKITIYLLNIPCLNCDLFGEFCAIKSIIFVVCMSMYIIQWLECTS